MAAPLRIREVEGHRNEVYLMRNPFTRRPRHSVPERTENDNGYSISYREMSCLEYSIHAQGLESRLTAREEMFAEQVKDYEEQLANQRRLMNNALRVAFNCGNMLGKVLQVNSLAPVLAADGKSVVVDFDTVTVTVLPFQEQLQVAIRGDVATNVFEVPDGRLSTDDQNRLIGIFSRSQRENPALDTDLSLAGVAVEDSIAS